MTPEEKLDEARAKEALREADEANRYFTFLEVATLAARPTASDLPVRFVGHVMPSHPARPVTDWMEATRYRPDQKERSYVWPNLTRKVPW